MRLPAVTILNCHIEYIHMPMLVRIRLQTDILYIV